MSGVSLPSHTDSRLLIITGTSSGLGLFMAQAAVKEGFLVAGCSRRPAAWEHENYTHYTCDVSDEKSVLGMFHAIRKSHGRVDCLINNAGIGPSAFAVLTTGEMMDDVYRINVRGTFLMAREAGKAMMRNRSGRIINISSIEVPLATEGASAYVASKCAVEGLTRVMAREFVESGVTVNAIGPSLMPTEMTNGFLSAGHIPDELKRRNLKQLGSMDDVWETARFLLSPAASGITGQIIHMGGV